jgi:hypothetical protein
MGPGSEEAGGDLSKPRRRKMEMVEDRRRMIMRWIGLFIGLVWAVLWTVFLAASALSQGFGPITGVEIGPSVVLVLGVLLLWVGPVIVWKRDLIGGVLMVTSGLLLLTGYYWFATGRVDLLGIMLVMLGMALPPLITGSLIIIIEKGKPA